MKLKSVVPIVALLALSGCATVQLTPGGRQVRTISPGVAQDCTHVGLASSFKAVIEGGISAAQIDIRNQVAALGGNAMIIVSQQVDPPPYQHGRIMAEVYKCSF